MNIPRQIANSQLEGESLLQAVYQLQRDIQRTAYQAITPSRLLLKAYELLTDEEKIAFLLTGGILSVFHHQQKEMGSDPQTGQLPILC